MSRRPIAMAITCLAVGSAALFGSATAQAAPADERFLDILTSLDIHFEPTSEAIATGRAVCDQIAAGQAQHLDAAEIRAGIVGGLMEMWMDNTAAANMMWAAVDIYCPQYTDMIGD